MKILASKTRASIIAISETWIDNTVANSEIELEGFNVIRNDRSRNGGGVCLYIKNDIAFNVRLDLCNDQIESIWAEILLPKTKPIVIGACYRPQTDTRFFEVFEDTLSKIRSDLELIILGDFNVDYALKQDHLLSKMKQALQLFDCKQLINSPTRVCRTRASI